MTLDLRRTFPDITSQDVVAYLVAKGWQQRLVENPNIAVYQTIGEDAEVAIPLRHSFRDYDSQMAYVFGILEEVEDRPAEELASDVLSTWADIVRVRIDPPTLFHRNTVDLAEGVTLIDESYRLLTSAARAAEHPQNVYSGGLTSPVSEYLRRTQLGHTEQGSFIVKIFSPNAPTPRDHRSKREEPFARSVTRTLHRSLEGIRSASEPRNEELGSSFERLVESGVSANLCDALAKIAEVSKSKSVDVTLTWSWKHPVEHARSANTIIPAVITPLLSDMSKHLRAMRPEPNVTLVGTVAKLTNKERANSDFGLGIEAIVDGRKRKVALDLTADARAIASQAWETGESIICTGMLDRRRFPYRITKPTKFELARDIDNQ